VAAELENWDTELRRKSLSDLRVLRDSEAVADAHARAVLDAVISEKESSDAAADPRERRIFIPADVSLGDLWNHTPARIVGKLFALLVSAFSAGVAVSESGAIEAVQRGLSSFSRSAPSTEFRNRMPSPSLAIRILPADEAALERLRREHAVELIAETQNDLPIERLPGGVYGFTTGYQADPSLGLGRLRVLGKNYPYAFEVHKTRQGEVFILGHVSEPEASTLADPTRPFRRTLIFAKPQPGFLRVVIPYRALARFEVRHTTDDRTIADIELVR
jgi:hypothetical protein